MVTVAQQSAEGRPLLGVFSGTVVALSYLVPTASRALAARVEAAADAAVVEQGLGPVLAHMLRRYRLPVTPERSLRLVSLGRQSRGRLIGRAWRWSAAD